MKKSVKKIFIVITMITLMLCCGVTTQANTKKLKVNAVYTNAKKVRGTTRLKKAKVIAKVGKKTYRTKSNRKGKYTIKIKKKRKKGTKIKVTVYRKKKVYAKKNVKVKAVPWYMKKPFKGHKAAIGGTGESFRKVPNQYDNKFTFYVKKGYWAKFKYGKYEKTVSSKQHVGYKNDKFNTWIYKIKTVDTSTGKNGTYGTPFSTSKGIVKSAVGNHKIKIKIYRIKDDKLVESYSITPRKIRVPSKTDEIDYGKFLRDYERVKRTGMEISKSISDKWVYRISSFRNNWGIDYAIGSPGYYFDEEANGAHVKVTSKHGATLYITVGVKADFNFPEPSLNKYDVMVKPGKTHKWEGIDFKEGELIDGNLCLKIYCYKNNILVGMRTLDLYLIQGYYDK